MMNELDYETKLMMYEPGERYKLARDIKPIEEMIKNAYDNIDFLLVAEVDNEIVGYIFARRGREKRIHHSAYIVIGIKKLYRGKGIGKEFFKQLHLWAKENEIKRLKLTVMCCNLPAKHLYEKCGFVIEGDKKKFYVC